MNRLSALIRYDKEFLSSANAIAEQLSAQKPLPIIINGLSAGAMDAYLAESVFEVSKRTKAPILMIVGSESERARVTAKLADYGIRAVEFKSRDLVFHNISASHDVERERLSVLSKIIRGECDVVVSTPSAALLYTVEEELLLSLAIGISVGDELRLEDLTERLITLGFVRVEAVENAGQFSQRGGIIDLWQSAESEPVRIEFFGDEVDRICECDFVTGKVINRLSHVAIFPASHYAVGDEKMEESLKRIEDDMRREVEAHKSQDKLLEAQRLLQRTSYDLEMMREIGYCSGIENYSRYFDGRKPGEPPFTLLDYFPKDFIVFIDESHMTMPQIRAMYNGDRSRKNNLVDYGFRLNSAYDNRPLTFNEFNSRIGQTIFISATPAEYELSLSDNNAEQVIRPTGLLDPLVEVRPTKGQIDDLQSEINSVVKSGGRVLITTLTKKMAESLTDYLKEQSVKVRYMHSDIDTLERIDIIQELRRGDIDVLVGINLLREGLDLPEVKLVAILDADKEGFLRSDTALIQTIGRTARNAEGRVIMYADTITGSMKRAMDETARRRKIQSAYNKAHGIVPKTIIKKIVHTLEITKKEDSTKDIKMMDIPEEIEKLKALMKIASQNLDFEKCIEIRDTIAKLKKKMRAK